MSYAAKLMRIILEQQEEIEQLKLKLEEKE